MQADFWGRIGITQSAGSRYENARKIPRTTQILLRLAYGSERDAHKLLTRLREAPMRAKYQFRGTGSVAQSTDQAAREYASAILCLTGCLRPSVQVECVPAVRRDFLMRLAGYVGRQVKPLLRWA